MPEVSLDFGNVGKIPNPGTYRVHIEKGKLGRSKEGNQMVTLDSEIVDEPSGEFEGFKPWPKLNIVFASSTMQFAQRTLEAVTQEPWREDGLKITVDEETNEVAELADRTVLVKFEHNTYNGQKQLKAVGWFPDNGEYEIEVQEDYDGENHEPEEGHLSEGM